MTYNLMFDQQFAVINDLSLTQVATLAAFMTLPTWAKTVAIDGHVWYMYSDEKMAEDFPLLFGVAKRCYKNINDLADMGFVQLTKLGRSKYVRFTERCRDWGKEKDQICTNSPKSDEIKSENGQMESPKTDGNYNIINNQPIMTNTADGGLFPGEPVMKQEPKQRGTTEPLCLFADSKYFDYEKFAACFDKEKFAGVDIEYYHGAVKRWSAAGGKKKRDWISTAVNFMHSDNDNGKLHKLSNNESFDIEGFKQYCEM